MKIVTPKEVRDAFSKETVEHIVSKINEALLTKDSYKQMLNGGGVKVFYNKILPPGTTRGEIVAALGFFTSSWTTKIEESSQLDEPYIEFKEIQFSGSWMDR
jgi:hypothetical protein